MPVYDQACESCGIHEAICSVDERNTCQVCGESCSLVPSCFSVQGIIYANAETSSQLGVTWHSNKEKRDWFKNHPSAHPVAKGSSEDIDFRNSIRQNADKAVQKFGYDSRAHYQREKSSERDLKEGKRQPKIIESM